MSQATLPMERTPESVVESPPALLDRLRRGDPAAVAAVYDEHQGALRAFARRLVGDAHAAEDLVHDVFVALPKAARSFRQESSLRTFLISIAINHARKHVRSAARRNAAFQRFADQRGTATDEPGHPEEAISRRQLALALNRALDKLPLAQRVAFVLCEVEQRTSREAAEIVGVPEETIRTRLFHARKKLRATLEQEGVR